MVHIVSIDFQKDFTAEGGKCYLPRPSVEFVKNTLCPFLRERDLKIIEITSDYRQPRPGDRGECCIPDTWGYKSEIPNDIKNPHTWIKCMNSPLWTREYIGQPEKVPGIPTQDPKGFEEWISHTIGSSEENEIVLIGLTLDCCVLCTAQEFSFRGYHVMILNEGVDVYSGSEKEKKEQLENGPVTNWAKPITWTQLREKL